MTAYGVILALVCGAENLLLNPGFETIYGDRPGHWELFVAPESGATGGADKTTAHDGDYSVRLHNPRTLPRDPCNNWSQNVELDLAGATLHVQGHIKVEEATQASVWLQCWRKSPWGTVRVATTGDSAPVSGTMDWTPVEMRVAVPDGTDFVTLRCVLNGQGTAWFDGLSVTKVGASTSPSDESDSSDPSDKSDLSDSSDMAPAEDAAPAESPLAPTATEEVAAAAEAEPAVAEPAVAEPEAAAPESAQEAPGGTPAAEDAVAAMGGVLDEIRALSETNQALVDQSDRLRQEIENLRRELEALRASRGTFEAPDGRMPAGAVSGLPGAMAEPSRKVPPLVPHGYNLEEMR